MTTPPTVILIGGPNGAGKTTISRRLIADALGVAECVNADVIAQGLSGFDPERAAMQAGRVMLTRLRELAAAKNAAFRQTFVGRTLSAVTIEDGGIALSDNYLKIELDSTREPNRLVDILIGGTGAHGVVRERSLLHVLA